MVSQLDQDLVDHGVSSGGAGRHAAILRSSSGTLASYPQDFWTR